ncbi:MAG TPA: anthranilate phosphoribosyltransferase [Chloroflexota bacterium]|nr:anthranilate phosphoribosyltransferase [Chloroflexota bacterium]
MTSLPDTTSQTSPIAGAAPDPGSERRFTVRDAIARLAERRDLTEAEAAAAMADIAEGIATPAQIGAFVTALRMKGETAEELAGLTRTMRQRLVPVPVEGDVVDTAGTGGDGAHTVNVSTLAALVAAAAGARVAKHGNRAASSACGSADLLEALGVAIDLPPAAVATCIEQAGIGFMFAPLFHPALRHAVAPRREIGIRTVFNLLGPLLNPAGARHQLLGVAVPALAGTMAEALRRTGSRHVLVVYGEDGLDEISLSGPTVVHELVAGEIRTYRLTPEEFGFARVPRTALRVDSLAESVALARRVLAGEHGPARDIVLLNAGATLLAADRVATLAEGVQRAEAALDSGAAARCLEHLRALSQDLKAQHGSGRP